ncbi:PREDICTED: T-cell leukemia translocation-altered gene protein [Nanorana parkeri]|uniref:T-cell leukemia translocation-altered gene protein n=1 Tax=Nanorana parkeri TaxID=125878 RepID=UPI000854AEDF|nr:PREDICTED: T-cell leukemia translocation-altered gene protein [Nanorana parkeri]
MALWGSELFSQFWDLVASLGSEFTEEWDRNDLRSAIFRLLLAWLLLSLTAIHLAWRSYGPTVTAFYYRQGPGGQNGGTPEYPSHFPIWESSSAESLKSHQE